MGLQLSGSVQLEGNITVTGSANSVFENVLVSGKLTAQEIETQFVSASIIYSSGSNKFGDESGDTHQFTGSVDITGSIILNGVSYTSLSEGSGGTSGAAFPYSGSVEITGSLNVTGSVILNGNTTTNGVVVSSGSISNFRKIYNIVEPGTTAENAFNEGGVNGVVFTSNLQTDGKIIIGGEFQEVNSVALNYIARLTNSGSVDSSFNTGSGFNATVQTTALQTDGKIVVGGYFTDYDGVTQNYITRLNSDGSRDTGFNIGTGFNGVVWNILIQLDGKIVVVGDFTDYNGTTQNRITRLNTDGSRDTGFNIGTGFNSTAYAIAEYFGRIYVGGSFTTYNGVTQNGIVSIFSNGSR